MDNTEAKPRQVMISALMMGLGTLASRLLGLVREMAFAAFFSKTITDAWTTAWRLPNLFRRLLGEGSLSVAFIPVYVREGQGVGGHQKAEALRDAFFTYLVLLLLILTALGTLFPEPFLRLLLDSEYELIPGKMALTVAYARIMFCFIFFVSIYAFYMALANTVGKFGLAAFAPTLFNLCMIVSSFSPSEFLGLPGGMLAWGVVVGGIAQAAVLVPLLIRKGILPRLTLKLRVPSVSQVLYAMGPGLFGTGLMQITTLVNLHFASRLQEGSISYLYWADRLLEVPLSLVSVSLGTALLPTLSRQWGLGQKDAMVSTLRHSLRVNLFLSLPAAIALIVFGELMVSVIFERGQFVGSDRLVTAQILQISAFTLLTASLVRGLVPGYYAVSNTWVPTAGSFLGLIAHLVLAPLLMERFGIRGLVMSTVLSGGVNLLVLAISFQILVHAFGWRDFFQGGMRFLTVLAVSAGAGFSWNYFSGQIFFDIFQQSWWVKASWLGSGMIFVAMIYSVLAYLFRLPEALQVFSFFGSRLRALRKSK